VEQLADALFPPRQTLFKGRSVTKEKFRNRIWAFIDESISSENLQKDALVQRLGKEADRLIDEVNAAVHGEPDKKRVMHSFMDLAKLSVALFQLTPDAMRRPYFAFQKNMAAFLEEALGQHAK
jgi:hypothetical protein